LVVRLLMQMSPHIMAFFLTIVFLAAGCQSDATNDSNIPVSRDSEMGQAIIRMDHGGDPSNDIGLFMVPWQEAPSYRDKAMEFIQYAQAGNVDQMLKITSALSRATQTDSIRSLYTKQVITQFQGTTVTLNHQIEQNFDKELQHPYLTFSGTAIGARTFLFSVSVEKENEILVIINIMKSH
jgi:hypothetical protein